MYDDNGCPSPVAQAAQPVEQQPCEAHHMPMHGAYADRLHVANASQRFASGVLAITGGAQVAALRLDLADVTE